MDADGESLVDGCSFSQKSGRVILAAERRLPQSFFIKNTDYYFNAFQNLLRYDNAVLEDQMMIYAGILEIISHLLREKPESKKPCSCPAWLRCFE